MCNVISHIHDSSIKMEKQMKIDDLYSNLNKDINSISKRKKQMHGHLKKWHLTKMQKTTYPCYQEQRTIVQAFRVLKVTYQSHLIEPPLREIP